jgi:hypothetical protein
VQIAAFQIRPSAVRRLADGRLLLGAPRQSRATFDCRGSSPIRIPGGEGQCPVATYHPGSVLINIFFLIIPEVPAD